MKWSRILSLIFVLIAALLSGCQSTSFYRQAVAGQCQILTHQEPIPKLIDDPSTSPKLKTKLAQILKLREFAARELKEPADKHYLKYVDLHREFAIWNVYAAPALSMEPKTWWFPIVGRASYRGYFSEESARKYAASLKKQGLDVFVGGVETYSTLGWFHDPVLNTFIYDPETDLAEIIFHELGHQKLFVSGDTDFNEAFATAVAEEGLRRWFQACNRPEAFERYRTELDQREEFTKLVMRTVKELDTVYTDKTISDAVKLERKQQIIEKLRADHNVLKAKWGGESPYDEWFKSPINNAKLSTVATYYELVPAFHAVLQANGGDMEKFYAAVKRIAKLPEGKRTEALESYLVREPLSGHLSSISK